jgi:uncharacterized cupredoxin-like copper-binding protein
MSRGPLSTVVAIVVVAIALVPVGSARIDAANVSVTLTEFRIKLSQAQVPRGTVTFKVANNGDIFHDFKIAGKKTPIYNPGKGGTLRVTFRKPGRYPFLCGVPTHAALGMRGVLRVT